MNILRIIFKEMKLNLRDFKANLMMVLFPIVLIMILGASFSGVFSSTIKLDDVKVLYTVEIGESNQAFIEGFRSFRQELTGKLGAEFIEIGDVNAGMAAIKEYKYHAYILITGTPPEIRLYKNEKRGFMADLIEEAVGSFTDIYGAMSAIAANNPMALGMSQMTESGNYVELQTLDEKRQPGSLDYYAVTMLTMILMYASFTGLSSIRGDITQGTGARTLCAPVRKYQYLAGNILGCISVTIVQGAAVILFSGLVLKAYWGEDLLTISIVLLFHAIMTVSLGAGLAFIFKGAVAADGLVNSLIPILVFLGGGYVPAGVMGDTFNRISVVSPVKWTNSALFRVIYSDDYSHVPVSLAINAVVATAFILIAAFMSGKGGQKHA